MNKTIKITLIIVAVLLIFYIYGDALSQKDLLKDERDYYKTTTIYFCGTAKNEASVIQFQSDLMKMRNELYVEPIFAKELLNKSCEDWIVGE